MIKNKKKIFLSLIIGILFIALMVCLRYHNDIYIWTIGDVNSIYNQAEKSYKEGDYSKALKLYTKLAKIDSASLCQYIVGDMYFQGKGIECDYEKSESYFIESAYGGNPDAQNNLGYIYTYVIGTNEDFGKAKKYLNMAAAQGHSQAQVGLGSLYRNGWGLSKDYHKALNLYKRAAAHNNTDALNNLGYTYPSAYGTKKDSSMALYYIKKSAAQNNPIALFNLGLYYIKGYAVNKDLEEGAKYLTKAAQYGLSTAQFNLGLMYHYGKGVEQNDSMAVCLFKQASAQGHKLATDFLNDMEENKTKENIDSIFELKMIAW